jgi:SAM-dependent methyltransferase
MFDPHDPGSSDVADLLRRYWDTDSATYDEWPEHEARSAAERAAWTAVIERALPGRDARVLDVGAGTGFLSLTAARLGCRVTALDISPRMLERLDAKARSEGLEVELVCAAADEPPAGPFDLVMERLLLWTVDDRVRALRAWREVAPTGRLLAIESSLGRDYVEGSRRRLRKAFSRVRKGPPEHHGPYPTELVAALQARQQEPWPDALIASVAEAGWRCPTLVRLRDVQWARELALPPLLRPLGVTIEYAILADAAGSAT